MTKQSESFPPDLSGLSRQDWLAQLRALGQARGFAEPLGPAHAALFVEDGDTLLVTFETLPAIEALSPTRTPLGFSLAQEAGWSTLTIMAQGETWFRDQGVFDFFAHLQEDAFFDDFERVIFYGAGAAGYAAAGASSACPGARVLVLQPQATLDPALASWDDRFVEARRLDFTGPYGFAPDHLAEAKSAHVVLDPRERLDAMHAALFARPGVAIHTMPFMGGALQFSLMDMKLLGPLLQAVADDKLTRMDFARLFRARRTYAPYLRHLLAQLDEAGRIDLSRALCRNVTARMAAPRFQRRLADIERGETETDFQNAED